MTVHEDWGQASQIFDEIKNFLSNRHITQENEAQTRFDVIDRLIREVLGWQHGQIQVEEHVDGSKAGYIDYILKQDDSSILIEAKRAGATFPNPTKAPRLKMTGSVLSSKEIANAIEQANSYASNKDVDVVIITNGLCWCYYDFHEATEQRFAYLLFPFEEDGHGEKLFDAFSVSNVANKGLQKITSVVPPQEKRLIYAIKGTDERVERNDLADHLGPALDNALYSDALLSNPEHLERCYIETDSRSRFDSTLDMFLTDPKPKSIVPAERIKRSKKGGKLEQIVAMPQQTSSPPVTLLLGSVGVGKSTYLRHFELVAGNSILQKKKALWVYIDFAGMGKGSSIRQYMYDALFKFMQRDHPSRKFDYKNTIEPAYELEITSFASGPFNLLYKNNKPEFEKKITEFINEELKKVEPYVDRILRYIAKTQLVVVVLDNVDLYEDDNLETQVFSEGLALSKRISANVIVSIRDSTFVRHHNKSTFNAYELRKLWLDPPPFRAVLSSRLTYSRAILKDKQADLVLPKGMHLKIPDLSVFFAIVQSSLLSGISGEFLEAFADLNIRQGLSLVSNFLNSGHANSVRAIRTYLEGKDTYYFPFHEVFKGSTLGQWRHFREDRTEAVNIFDSRLGSRSTRLARLILLEFLFQKARIKDSSETMVDECITLLTKVGASERQIITLISNLCDKGLLRNIKVEDISSASAIVLTKRGGYYSQILSRQFVYVEECSYDTAIEDAETWDTLIELTSEIENERKYIEQWELRKQRVDCFLSYLANLEKQNLKAIGSAYNLECMEDIRKVMLQTADAVIKKFQKTYG